MTDNTIFILKAFDPEAGINAQTDHNFLTIYVRENISFKGLFI